MPQPVRSTGGGSRQPLHVSPRRFLRQRDRSSSADAGSASTFAVARWYVGVFGRRRESAMHLKHAQFVRAVGAHARVLVTC